MKKLNAKYVFYLEDTPAGTLTIAADDNALKAVSFGKVLVENAEIKETPLIKNTIKQLNEYFEGKRKTFDLPLAPDGTAFQQKVWQALQTIPYGETYSYKDIAEAVKSPKGFRAVGMANNKNHIAIIIPCHRVIGANGKLVGYAGGLDIKVKLLEIEEKHKHDE